MGLLPTCVQSELFSKVHAGNRHHSVHLPDGSVKLISQMGNIKLAEDTVLLNALFVPSFKYNLSSVGQLSRDNGIEMVFSTNYCYLQDQKSKRVKAVAWMVDGLFLLDQSSFSPDVLNS